MPIILPARKRKDDDDWWQIAAATNRPSLETIDGEDEGHRAVWPFFLLSKTRYLSHFVRRLRFIWRID